MYTMRNKRSIAHKGKVAPNVYDLRYLYGAAQWVLSDIVRHIMQNDMETAGRLVEFIQIPADMLVEDFGDKRLVLASGTVREELLLLLLHYYPEPSASSQIQKDMDRREPGTISKAIRAAYKEKLVEGNRAQGYKLTSAGHRRATELAKTTVAL